jgi:pimeloyl-ACP methyl ester carboxylesterase
MVSKSLVLHLCLALSTLINSTFGQSIVRSNGKVRGRTYSYYSQRPAQKIVGVLLLLHGWGERPESILKKTKLPQILSENGFLIIAPELRQISFADQYTIAEIDQILKAQFEKYKLNEPDLILGGFSAGGAIAVEYGEYLLASATTGGLKAIFAIDLALDLRRLYRSAVNKMNYHCDGIIFKEGRYTINNLEEALGGSPETRPDQYLKYSAYSANAGDGGNAKLLRSIPIRFYSEPDLEFVRKAYCEELQAEDINAFDLESLSRFLKQLGNTNSESITTKGKGFHSWRILDAEDCANWIVKICSKK